MSSVEDEVGVVGAIKVVICIESLIDRYTKELQNRDFQVFNIIELFNVLKLKERIELQ